jgi:hypothetical protein
MRRRPPHCWHFSRSTANTRETNLGRVAEQRVKVRRVVIVEIDTDA